jgi:hypothetical protein
MPVIPALWRLKQEDQDLEVSQAPVVYTSNPSYLGGRDQEDQSLKPAWTNSSMRPYLENIQHNKGLVEWLRW